MTDQFQWVFIGVYGPNRESSFLLEELFGLISWWDAPWYVGGDINETCFPTERMDAKAFTLAIHDFSDFYLSTWIARHSFEGVTLHGQIAMRMSQ